MHVPAAVAGGEHSGIAVESTYLVRLLGFDVTTYNFRINIVTFISSLIVDLVVMFAMQAFGGKRAPQEIGNAKG